MCHSGERNCCHEGSQTHQGQGCRCACACESGDSRSCGCNCGCSDGGAGSCSECTCESSSSSCKCEQTGGFRRRFKNKAEIIAELEAYLSELKAEVQGVEERIKELRG
jgi:hypothetical protein